jgi:outer membrane protein OmpA-like peptidoglycan-associated protein
LHASTEFNNDAYHLSLLGRGFLRIEINNFLETELGFGFGELNGKDFNNNNWSTIIFPTDFRLIFSPFNFNITSPYIYSGIGILRWNLTKEPLMTSQNKSSKIGWDTSIPVGTGIEIALSDEILLDISGGYTFTSTDDLNYYNKPLVNDGYFDFGFGLTFVMGGGKLDEDGDGLSSKFEYDIGTDSKKSDTDGDGISDGDEVLIYKTNPLSRDSDKDGLEDYEEVFVYKTDPNSVDTDGDGISDYDEVLKYHSNPLLKDTDSDGLSDGYEINIYNTSPTNQDSDGDGISDSDEIHKYKTDPNNPDTDGDGISDGDEIMIYKTDPLIFNTFSQKQIQTFEEETSRVNSTVLKGITFKTDKSDLNEEAEIILAVTLEKLRNNSNLNIEIRGYTDNVGNSNYNKTLSQKRADEVRLWFVKKGIDALRIKAVGKGDLNPIEDNSTEKGRELNRRIEIVEIYD